MKNLVIPKNYSCFDKAGDFLSLCKPLIDNSNIDMIAYIRSYSDGSFFAFNTYLEYEKHLIYGNFDSKNIIIMDFKTLEAISQNPRFLKNNKSAWFLTEIYQEKYLQQAFQDFNLSSYFCISKKFGDYYEGFEFASTKNKNISSFYFNHYDILENFMPYIRSKGTDLIKEAQNNKIYFKDPHSEYKKVMKDLERKIATEENNLAKLKDNFKLKQYIIHHQNKKALLTYRELECLHCTSQGMTAKEAGIILRITPRTIEKHIHNIKEKLGVSFKSQLLKAYRSNSLNHCQTLHTS